MEADPEIALPVRSHPARNVEPGGFELVNLSRLRVEPTYFVRFPLCKPNPTISRDIDSVSAGVLLGLDEVRNVIGDELLGFDIQSDNPGAGSRPDHLSIRVGSHAVAGDLTLEKVGRKGGELLVLGVELQPAAVGANLRHPDRVSGASHRRPHVIESRKLLRPGGRTDLGKLILLRIESSELVLVEFVHPGDALRIDRDVVKGRVQIRYRIIYSDISGGGALQRCSREAAIGIGHWRVE